MTDGGTHSGRREGGRGGWRGGVAGLTLELVGSRSSGTRTAPGYDPSPLESRLERFARAGFDATPLSSYRDRETLPVPTGRRDALSLTPADAAHPGPITRTGDDPP